MACCAALAIVFATVRTAWAWMLGRDPVAEEFPPAAVWGAGRDVGRPMPQASVGVAGIATGRVLAATVLVYGLLIHVLASTGLALVEPVGIAAWVVRDAALAAVMGVLLVLGRRRTATAAALAGAGALWFALGVIDMHVVGGFEFHAAPLALDIAFHLSGWWLMVAATGVLVVQRREGVVPVGAAA